MAPGCTNVGVTPSWYGFIIRAGWGRLDQFPELPGPLGRRLWRRRFWHDVDDFKLATGDPFGDHAAWQDARLSAYESILDGVDYAIYLDLHTIFDFKP